MLNFKLLYIYIYFLFNQYICLLLYNFVTTYQIVYFFKIVLFVARIPSEGTADKSSYVAICHQKHQSYCSNKLFILLGKDALRYRKFRRHVEIVPL